MFTEVITVSFARKLAAAFALMFAFAFLFVLAAFAKTAYMTESAKIYKKANTDSKHQSISVGTKVDLISTKDGWAKVEYKGKTGFVKSKYVSEAVDAGGATMYLKQSDTIKKSIGSSKKVASVKKGDAVKVMKTCGEWSLVKLGDKKGVLKSSHLTKSVPESDTKTYWVSGKTAGVFASRSTSSKKLETLKAGDKVKVISTSGKWAHVIAGSGTGYIKKSAIVSSRDNVPTYKKKTCAIKKEGAALYANIGDSKAKDYFSKDTIVTVTAYTKSWAYVKTKSSSGYVRTSNLKNTFASPKSSAVPAKGRAETADWYTSGIQRKFAKGTKAVVTDVDTKRAITVYRKGGHNHADVEPASLDDTKVLKEIYGGSWSWKRRAVFVTINGKNYAASMNGKPHGECTIKTNGFPGHFCIHFTNSKTHGSQKVDPEHQKMVKKASKSKL